MLSRLTHSSRQINRRECYRPRSIPICIYSATAAMGPDATLCFLVSSKPQRRRKNVDYQRSFFTSRLFLFKRSIPLKKKQSEATVTTLIAAIKKAILDCRKHSLVDAFSADQRTATFITMIALSPSHHYMTACYERARDSNTLLVGTSQSVT